jgi:hypothetical protein
MNGSDAIALVILMTSLSATNKHLDAQVLRLRPSNHRRQLHLSFFFMSWSTVYLIKHPGGPISVRTSHSALQKS